MNTGCVSAAIDRLAPSLGLAKDREEQRVTGVRTKRVAASSGETGMLAIFERTITWDGMARRYTVYVSAAIAADPSVVRPLMVVLHGGNGGSDIGRSQLLAQSVATSPAMR